VNKATILVVEDDSNLMSGIRDILELQDYHVLTANNGLEGLSVIRAQTDVPDLILSDIMMPHMNGYEFFDEVRKETRFAAIPFIFLTARGEKSDIRVGKAMGADDYVVKPFNAEDLLIVIEAKLRRREELERIHKAEIGDLKQSILTILNHEFRTPLTYIVAYADLLNQDAATLNYTEINDFLQAMGLGADRLRRLVENFILLVELETGEGKKAFASRRRQLDDPILALADACDQIESVARQKGIDVRVQQSNDQWPNVTVDPVYLKLALICLIENAIKFSDAPGKTILLDASVSDHEVWLSVQDEGRGIAQDQHEVIFDMFYQIDRATHEDQGAGVGLAIVKRVMDLHSGRVVVESVVGEGSRFSLVFPIQT
jgi:two-component system sensor histidine kinase/response regulator